MCGFDRSMMPGWVGWNDIPAPSLSASTAPWEEISHSLTDTLSAIPGYPKPTIRKLKSMPEAPADLTEIQLITHYGTHVDAPGHFLMEGPKFDQVPLERLWGQGVVWHINPGDYGLIDVADLELARPRMQPGDIVLFDTGRGKLMAHPAYDRHASLTPEAAEWLVNRGARMVGVDFSTPDLANEVRPKGFNWPVHHILLSQGILIAEHVANLDRFAGHRIDAMFNGLNIHGSDGSPTRAIARRAD